MKRGSLGLKRGAVELSEYDSLWHEEFLLEKKSLEEALESKMLKVEHIGSTAVPNIKAKPVLDLMVGVPSLEKWEEFKEPLKKLGYEFRKDFKDSLEHILFVKGPEENRTHYLKLTEITSNFWKEHLLFRDLLVNNPELRKEYENIKESLLKKYPNDRGLYSEGKKEFIEKALGLGEGSI